MTTCVDCAWYSVCEPQDILSPCQDFIQPEELQRRIGQALYEELLRHRASSPSEEESEKSKGGEPGRNRARHPPRS